MTQSKIREVEKIGKMRIGESDKKKKIKLGNQNMLKIRKKTRKEVE